MTIAYMVDATGMDDEGFRLAKQVSRELGGAYCSRVSLQWHRGSYKTVTPPSFVFLKKSAAEEAEVKITQIREQYPCQS